MGNYKKKGRPEFVKPTRGPAMKYQQVARIADKNSVLLSKIAQLGEIMQLSSYASVDKNHIVPALIDKYKKRLNRRLMKLAKWSDCSADERHQEFKVFKNYQSRSLHQPKSLKPSTSSSSLNQFDRPAVEGTALLRSNTRYSKSLIDQEEKEKEMKQEDVEISTKNGDEVTANSTSTTTDATTTDATTTDATTTDATNVDATTADAATADATTISVVVNSVAATTTDATTTDSATIAAPVSEEQQPLSGDQKIE